MNPSDFLGRLGRTVAFYPGLVKHLGGVNATIFFCQLFYWSQKASSDLGVYKTATEFTEETGLTVDEQRTARIHLRRCGVLIETEKRLEHRIYYRLDLERFNALVGHSAPLANAETPIPEIGTSQPRNGNIPFGSEEVTSREVGNVQPDKEQEITSEITAESTAVEKTIVGAGGADLPETPLAAEEPLAGKQGGKRSGKPKPEAIDLDRVEIPEHIQREVFVEYGNMRRDVLKKPLSIYSLAGVLRELERYGGQGHDANKLLQRSTGKEWLSFVPDESTLTDVQTTRQTYEPVSAAQWWGEPSSDPEGEHVN